MCSGSHRAVTDVHAQTLSPESKLGFDLVWNLATTVLEFCL